MSEIQFTKRATKKNAKLRLAVCGPAGSGKTYTLLKFAQELGGPIAAIDTERGSMSLYSDEFEFYPQEPALYDPTWLVEAINAAADQGCNVVIIDSLSHFWQGVGGELDKVDQAAKKLQGNSFGAWKSVTPLHNRLVDTMTSAPIHVLVSMRSKTEWVVEKNERTGKSEPRRVGTQPIMRDQIEFEFGIFAEMDQENNFMVMKSRCKELQGRVFNKPGKDVMEIVKKWLTDPVPEEKPAWTAPIEAFRPAVGEEEYKRALGQYATAADIPDREKALAIIGQLKQIASASVN